MLEINKIYLGNSYEKFNACPALDISSEELPF